MAKRKKRSKCPEPFNTLIDIAAGATMHAIADKMGKNMSIIKEERPTRIVHQHMASPPEDLTRLKILLDSAV